MLIDENGKLFSKISIVDIAVVVFIISAVAFVGLKFFAPWGNNYSGGSVNCEYTFKVSNVRQASVDAINKSVGKNVYDAEGLNLGVISRVESVKPYMDSVEKNDGTMVLAQVPDKYEITVSVVVEGNMTAEGISVAGKKELSVGSHLSLSTPEITTETVITGLRMK